MLLWDDPHPSRLTQCPMCGCHALAGPVNTQVVIFQRDHALNHLLWSCPAEDCSARMMALATEETLRAFLAAGYPGWGAEQAPDWVRAEIEAGWEAARLLGAAPISEDDQTRFIAQLEVLHGVEEFLYRCEP
jgi:hypothetical protein